MELIVYTWLVGYLKLAAQTLLTYLPTSFVANNKKSCLLIAVLAEKPLLFLCFIL